MLQALKTCLEGIFNLASSSRSRVVMDKHIKMNMQRSFLLSGTALQIKSMPRSAKDGLLFIRLRIFPSTATMALFDVQQLSFAIVFLPVT